ncbi:MAG: hypothetical protein RL026_1976 [Pseudomonadota bacterium]|jgi:ATP-binding cassette subfamily B protein
MAQTAGVAAGERPKSRSLRPLRSLLPFLAPHRATLVAALLALLLASAAMLALPPALRRLVDEGMATRDAASLDRAFLLFLGASVVFGVFAALRYYLVTWLGERVVADLRAAVYERVVRMDTTFFEVTRTGEVLSRLTTDTTLVQSISGVGLSITLRSSVNLLGALVMMGATSPRLMGLLLLLVPVVLLPLFAVGRSLRKLSRESQDRVADASALADETLNAVQVLQAFTLEALQSARFRDAAEQGFKVAVRRNRVRALLTALGTMLVMGAITLVVWLGARAVLDGELTAGQLGQFLLYSVFVMTAAAALIEQWGEVQRAAGAMERLTELLQARPAIAPPPPAEAQVLPEGGRGGLLLGGLRFRYPSRPEQVAIDGLDLAVAPGEHVAIVGPSGAGKTTLFQLLLRFHDPEAGVIKFDGVDIRRVDPVALRQRIALVPQDTVLFGTSIRENIRYGRPGATDPEVEVAAQAAAAAEFIEALPQGYDTFIGERGTRLSGGQRQRVAIARALLKDPPLLLLDEATSALDSASERQVQAALQRLTEGRTTLVIAHRLSTVQRADRIVVLDHGRVVDIGRHTELMLRCPLYARLAGSQALTAEP